MRLVNAWLTKLGRMGSLFALMVCVWFAPAVHAAGLELQSLDASRSEEGVTISYQVNLELAKPVEDALLKGVPLNFVARAALYRERWYWRDRQISEVRRDWRLTYQPLTRQYRTSLGTLSQSHDTLTDALATMRRATQWRVADPVSPSSEERYYLDFDFRLDTSRLPGPMQLGVDRQADWNLYVARTVPLP